MLRVRQSLARRFLICLFVMLSVQPVSVLSSENLSGQWSGVISNEDGSSYSVLTLKIRQSGDKLSGVYCYVTRGGNRIDCPDEGENNLRGDVGNSKATIEFDSSFGGKNGKAELTLNGEKLLWHLIKEPQNGDFYAPENYELDRQDVKKIAMQKARSFKTQSFIITLVNNCGDFFASCSDVKYYGMRNSDQSQIVLAGHTIDNSASGKIDGMLFKNGNIEYLIDFEPLKLKVSQGAKVLVEQDGHWE
ncbi:hypothetical protein [Pantoea sp. App145]|uniref:hypothetical protein n=1 Tax=Pantoea sp. App145 TaxID=3071567 RepID=UPI003A8069DB